MDYSITWAYIVDRMESRYGISPDDETPQAFGNFEAYILNIWTEYFEILYEKEFGERRTDGVK